MKIILLPGNSSSNRKWIEKVRDNFKDIFESINVQYYNHWETGEELIDFSYEKKELVKKINLSKEYAIFAKSAGVILTLRVIVEEKIKPKFCVFLGTPIHWTNANKFGVDEIFGKDDIPKLFIQKSHDPAISFKELDNFLKKSNVRNYKLVEIEGDNHDYDDVERIKTLVREFENG